MSLLVLLSSKINAAEILPLCTRWLVYTCIYNLYIIGAYVCTYQLCRRNGTFKVHPVCVLQGVGFAEPDNHTHERQAHQYHKCQGLYQTSCLFTHTSHNCSFLSTLLSFVLNSATYPYNHLLITAILDVLFVTFRTVY